MNGGGGSFRSEVEPVYAMVLVGTAAVGPQGRSSQKLKDIEYLRGHIYHIFYTKFPYYIQKLFLRLGGICGALFGGGGVLSNSKTPPPAYM